MKKYTGRAGRAPIVVWRGAARSAAFVGTRDNREKHNQNWPRSPGLCARPLRFGRCDPGSEASGKSFRPRFPLQTPDLPRYLPLLEGRAGQSSVHLKKSSPRKTTSTVLQANESHSQQNSGRTLHKSHLLTCVGIARAIILAPCTFSMISGWRYH